MTHTASRMVRTALVVGVGLGIPAAVVAGMLRGSHALWTAVGATVLVVGGFALSGLGLRWASRRSPASVQAVMVGGLLLRLCLYAILLVTLPATGVVDEPTLAVVIPLVTFVLLAAEVRLVTHPDFRMIHPAAAGSIGKDSK